MKGNIIYSPILSQDGYNRVRILVVQDKQANGGPRAEYYEVLQNVATVKPIDNFKKLANQGRFKILKDKMYTFNAKTREPGGLWAPQQVNIDFKISGLNVPIIYQGSTGTLPETQSNNFFILAISDHFIPFSTERPLLSIHTTMRYTDS